MACVVTCGGAAAAITAVTLVSNGFAAATTSATVAAGIFIGTSTAVSYTHLTLPTKRIV